jgi:hypothetical protein
MIKNVFYNEHAKKIQKEKDGKFVDLTDLDKFNHVKPFIDYLQLLITKHSGLDESNKDDREYICYISIGGSPENDDERNFFQLFPNLWIKPNTKIYYIGIGEFKDLSKIIDYKDENFIEIKLFNMYWIDNCHELIEAFKAFVDFNSNNSKCLYTVCVNFAKFKVIGSPIFENLTNIFPTFETRILQFTKTQLVKNIISKKAAYLHSFGYKEINGIKKEKGEKMVESRNLSSKVSLQDIKQISWPLETREIKKLFDFYSDFEHEKGILGEDKTGNILANIIFYFDLFEGCILLFPYEDEDEDDLIPVATFIDPEGEQMLYKEIDRGKYIVEAGDLTIEQKKSKKESSPKKKSENNGGGNNFEKIINPLTGRKVKTNSKLGIKIISKYLDSINY